MLLPVTPEKLDISINNANKTVNLIDIGQVNILKRPNLSDVSFEFLIPSHKYPFANGSAMSVSDFIGKLEKLKKNKKKFQFIVTRTMPNGASSFSTNMKCSLESYTIKEDASRYGTDVMVSVKLRQFKSYSTKTVKLQPTPTAVTATVEETRPTDNSPAPQTAQTYTVKRGDTLWKIAKQFYGDGSKYPVIASVSGVKNPDLILDGQVLTIPPL